MSWRTVGILIAGVLVVLAGVAFVLPFFARPGGGWTPSARGNLKIATIALYMYQEKNGCLPGDPRGSGYALYLLKDIVEGYAGAFSDPFAEAKGIPAPRFDDERRMLVGSHFAYLNDPRPPTEDMIVLAEVPGLNPKRRFYLTLNGRVRSIEAETDPLANRPLLGLRLVDGKFVPIGGAAATSAESSTQ
jgi:hypothetical protein